MVSIVAYAKNFLAENFGGPASRLGTHQFRLDDTPDLSGKVAVVTGGSEGIGYGISYTLLQHNIAKLYLLSVSADVVKRAKEAVAKDLGQAAADRTEWMQCELSDWDRVEDVAEKIRSSTDRLDILVNNAGRGIMTYQLTDYGIDRHMAVNHIGHAILTSRLLPLMKRTGKEGSIVRIVNMASNLHENVPKEVSFKAVADLNQDLGAKAQYGRSKLAAILFARYFDRNVTQKGHPNLLMNATHPGIVSTKQSKQDIHEAFPLAGYAMSVGLQPFKKNQFQGALSMVFAATTTVHSGQYICPPSVPEPGSNLSQDSQLATDLMELTREVVKKKTRGRSGATGSPLDDLVGK